MTEILLLLMVLFTALTAMAVVRAKNQQRELRPVPVRASRPYKFRRSR